MSETIKTAKEAIALAKRKEMKIIDIRFTDLFGTWQHCCPCLAPAN